MTKCLPTNFCFTLNNYTEEQVLGLIGLGQELSTFGYICWGKEVGSSGTPHLQGYGECSKRVNFDKGRKLLYNSHIEKRRGTVEQAITYCKKDGDFVEFGASKDNTPGKRNDLLDLKNKLLNGDSLKSICSDAPELLRYSNGLKLAEKMFSPKLVKPEVQVRWYYGASGTGKTHDAVNEFGLDSTYIKSLDNKWWDGYNPETHKCVVLDDYDSNCTVHWGDGKLKRLLDKYPVDVEYKGGVLPFIPSFIIITSEFPPEHFFYEVTNPNRLAQIESRLHFITKYSGVNKRLSTGGPVRNEKSNGEFIQYSEVVG